VVGSAARIGALFVAVLLVAAGSVWAATINGTSRNDTLRGSPAGDRLYGKGGNDKLFGAGGKDVLVGGAGNDALVGGAGADTLRCGSGRDTATRDLRDTVARDCEIVRGPNPVEPPPPPPPPPSPPPAPPAPGAPATYVFGPEVTQAQQATVRDALDLAARYYRTALGLEAAPFSVWVYTDAEALARVFAEKSGEVANVEQARALWSQLVAHAGSSGLWVGPAWFSQGAAGGKWVLAKEEFILLLYTIAGPTSLNSGDDNIPRAGPRWLSEGTAVSSAYLAIADAGLISMPGVRSQWAQQTKSSPVTLQRLAIRRGQLEAGSNAWGIMPLAVERLVGDAGVTKLRSYFAAIGRGEAWETAFATAFGKSVDAFYAEFAAYRSGL
jgi:hypothetical protein